MTLQELLTDLKAAGANENTIRLAMNCWIAGQLDMRDKAIALAQTGKIHFAPPNIEAVNAYNTALERYAESIRGIEVKHV